MKEYIYVDKNGKGRKASKKHKYWYRYEFALITGEKITKRTYGGETWTVGQAREEYFKIWRELRTQPKIDKIIELNKKIEKIY